MNRFALALRTARAIIKQTELAPDVAGMIASVFPMRGDPPKRGTTEILEAYSTQPWLRAVTTKVATAVAAVNWRLYSTRRMTNGRRFYRNYILQRTAPWSQRRKLFIAAKQQGELVEIEQHPMLSLLHNANPLHVGVAARRILQIHMDLAGEFYQLLERNAMGAPIAYWPVPPQMVKEIPTPRTPYYKLHMGSVDYDVPATEVIWAADPDPLNPYGRGTSISRTLADELETAEYASQHTKAVFYNRARPDFIAWVKSQPGEGAVSVREMRRLQQQWMSEHGGFWRAFKPHFINRELQIHEFEQDLRKQSVIELMQHERDTIIQVFGFPPEIFGILQQSNRATIDAADYLFAKYAVEPRLEFLREIWQERLVPLYDERLILDYDSPVAEDKDYILNVMKAQPAAFMADEWRALAEHEALDDEEGRLHLAPMNTVAVQTLDELTISEPAPAPAPAPPEPDDDDDAGAASAGSGVEKRIDSTYRLLHQIADRLEPSMRRAFLRAVEALEAAVPASELLSAVRSQNIARIVNSIPWDTFTARLGEESAGILRRIINNVGVLSAERIGARLGGVEVGFDMGGKNVVRWLTAHRKEFLSGVEAANKDAIRAALGRYFKEELSAEELVVRIRRNVGLTERQWLSVDKFQNRLEGQGHSPASVQQRVNRYVGAQRTKRAQMIARTETIRAANGGQHLAYEQAIEDGHLRAKSVKRIWQVTPDDRLDIEICEPMEGQEAMGMDEPFITGAGTAVDFPPAHPMCRCSVAYDFG